MGFLFPEEDSKKNTSYGFTDIIWEPGDRHYAGEYLTKEAKFSFMSFWNCLRSIAEEPAVSDNNCDTWLRELSKHLDTFEGVVAGSAPAFSYIGEIERAHDIDVFFLSKRLFDKIPLNPSKPFFEYGTNKWYLNPDQCAQYQKDPSAVRYIMAEHSSTNNLDLQKDIQLNKMIWYEDARSVIQSFDFTCCKVALYKDFYIYDKQGIEDLKNGKIYATGVWHVGNFLHRILKYKMRGFTFDGDSGRLPKMSGIESDNPIKFSGNLYAAIADEVKNPAYKGKDVDKEFMARYYGFASYEDMQRVRGE